MGTTPRLGPEFGGYRIEGLIGRGGMGEVYLAHHPRLDVKHVIKVLSQQYADDESFRERFVREAQLAASLSHPNIIPIYDFGEEQGLLFLVMPYIEGSDLRRMLQNQGHLEPAEAIRVLEPVASALDAAHAEGLVHRDVKPENILIQRRASGAFRVYLTDFGLTKRLESSSALTRMDQILGTLYYIAPEQIHRQDIDGRTDIYSLGCVLYECLTGRTPFDRETEGALLFAHLMDPPPKVTAVRPELSAEVDGVVARAMAKEKEHRHATCQALVDAAREALRPVAQRGPAPMPPMPGPPPMQRTIQVDSSQVPPVPTGTPGAVPVPPGPLPTPPPHRVEPFRPPQAPRRRVGLFVGIGGAVAVVLVIVLVLVLGGGSSRYPEGARNQFINDCVAGGGSQASCECSIEQLEATFSFAEFQQINAESIAGAPPPPEFFQAVAPCIGL